MPLVPINGLGCTALAAGLVLGLATASRAASPTLYVHYNAACTFAVVGDAGTAVTTIPPGTYQVVIDTPFAFANEEAKCSSVEFRLSGPGVSVTTDLGSGDSVTEEVTETLQPSSTYTLQDDAQPAQTRRTLTTTASGSPATTDSSSSSSSSTCASSSAGKTGSSSQGSSQSVLGTTITTTFRGTLAAAVSSTGKLTLTKGGRSVSNLKSGRYTFIVQDRSAKSDFTIQQLHRNPLTLTGLAFVGTHKTTVDLKPGQWTFYSYSSKTNYFIVIP